MPSDSWKSLFTSHSRTNYQLQEEQSKHVISDCDNKQQLNRIKSSSAHLSLELGLQLLKRSSGMVTGLGGGGAGIKINLFIWISYSLILTQSGRGALTDWTAASASAAEQQNGLSVMLVLVLVERRKKKITEVHFWHSCPQNNAEKNIKGLGKAFKGRKTLNNWADPQNLCTQGLIIIIEIALLPPPHIDFGKMWPSVSILTLNLLQTHQFNSPVSVFLETSAFQNSWVSLTVLMAKSCKNRVRFIRNELFLPPSFI